MPRLFGAVLAVLALTGSASQALAQEAGDVQRGFTVARQVCSECHAIRLGARSPARQAPTFEKLANTPGVNAMALYVALHTSHDQMPNFMLEAGERDDVIAYILSLKQAK